MLTDPETLKAYLDFARSKQGVAYYNLQAEECKKRRSLTKVSCSACTIHSGRIEDIEENTGLEHVALDKAWFLNNKPQEVYYLERRFYASQLRMGRTPKPSEPSEKLTSLREQLLTEDRPAFPERTTAFRGTLQGSPPIARVPFKITKRTRRDISNSLRVKVLMRDGATCRLCGIRPEQGAQLHVDHIIPWSKGGETTLDNLQILCSKCNLGKSDLSPAVLGKGTL